MNHAFMERAWFILKGKRMLLTTERLLVLKKCGNCKAWDSSKTDDPMTGYCKWYDFIL